MWNHSGTVENISNINVLLLYVRHSGMASDHVPFRLHVRRSGPNNTNPSWQVNVTSSPARYNITALPTLPFLGLPGNPHESPISKVYSSLVSLMSTSETKKICI